MPGQMPEEPTRKSVLQTEIGQITGICGSEVFWKPLRHRRMWRIVGCDEGLIVERFIERLLQPIEMIPEFQNNIGCPQPTVSFCCNADKGRDCTSYANDGELSNQIMHCRQAIRVSPRGGMRLIGTKGRRRAVVAVARKLAVLLHRMWIDGTEFRQEPVGGKA